MSDRDLEDRPSRPRWLGAMARTRGCWLGGSILLLLLVVGVFAPYLAPYDPGRINAAMRLRPPSPAHLMGTDGFGRDILSRVIFGTRLSFQVGLCVVVLSTACGVILGLVAGYYRRVDNLLMRFLDGIMAFPSIVLQIAIMAALGPRLSNVIFALSFSYVPRMARIVRGSVLSVREELYVDAARAVGASDLRTMFVHVLPNCMAPVIIQATMIFSYSILSEASLSFLGVGVPPEIPSWGTVLSEGRILIRSAPWITTYPGLVIATSVLATNTLGDGLRDALDPKLQ